MMKKILFLVLLFSFKTYAEPSRAPAVLESSCQLVVETSTKTIINGKEVKTEKAVDVILKEQCLAVKKCMNSASDEEMESLKNLELVACKNILKPVTTKTPGRAVESDFDGERKAKPNTNRDSYENQETSESAKTKQR